ncbi:MAG: type II secretion system protein [Phycisphaerae bacterium]|nr:type II secretion system protein [Phycisphaerae bacterium]
MKSNAPQRRSAGGFTLVEMLTTMAIAAILISLLVPAFGLIRNAATSVRQKAQFNAIGLALEGYRTDFKDYPPSNYFVPGAMVGTDYCGAQKLAEAVVGWDGFGVHPQTAFQGTGMNDVDGDSLPELIYDVLNGIRGTNTNVAQPVQTFVDNRRVRKGPYLELEAANAVRLSDIYGSGNLPAIGGTALADTYVLADQFGKVTHARTRKKTGMPILYFKANLAGYQHVLPVPMNSANIPNLKYNVRDNRPFYFTPPPFALNSQHPLGSGEQAQFYQRTTNTNLTGPLPQPYRSESYILLSAGRDGLYGTADDVFNFDTEQ